MSRIIAFTGKMGSGKNTAANLVAEMNPERQLAEYNFADPIRHICALVFGLTWEEMTDPVLKETKLDRWPFEAPRTLLRDVGMFFRDRWPGTWVNKFERSTQEFFATYPNGLVLNTDLRFIDEGIKIEELDGEKVRVVRPGREGDSHPSETEMDQIRVHVTIHNDGTIDDLRAKLQVAL
ncbi:nucleoside/nucleotide kinase family protein [Inquilinus limosus]|uniref:Deoxynucleotide monophosphate kinase n=1 Tax=Inquilinus limosus MP06 TaxID=1398085 RepID=A0A0A0DGJ1_9PROT|nr:hypothetical protein [Inquilinus limosus]KGM36112.1 hypothetical protein P409_00235 [Inquilinus limosus MP06]